MMLRMLVEKVIETVNTELVYMATARLDSKPDVRDEFGPYCGSMHLEFTGENRGQFAPGDLLLIDIKRDGKLDFALEARDRVAVMANRTPHWSDAENTA